MRFLSCAKLASSGRSILCAARVMGTARGNGSCSRNKPLVKQKTCIHFIHPETRNSSTGFWKHLCAPPPLSTLARSNPPALFECLQTQLVFFVKTFHAHIWHAKPLLYAAAVVIVVSSHPVATLVMKISHFETLVEQQACFRHVPRVNPRTNNKKQQREMRHLCTH